MAEHSDILIVGGGVIGACCAGELAATGAAVTLLERDEPPAVDSGVYANAGLITPSDAYPLASPGVLGKGMKWLLDSGSPFYVAPLADKDLPGWLAQFAQNCRDEPMRRAMPVQRALLRASADLFTELAPEIAAACGYEQKGWLWVFETPDGLKLSLDEIPESSALGVKSEAIDAARLPEFAPGLAGGFAGGRFQAEDAHVNPMLFVREMARLAQERGALLRTRTEVLRFEASGDRITRVVTSRGDFTADTVVLAAGAWSAALGRQVGLRLPIQAAKGYSVTVKRPETTPEFPLYLGERHVCITPLGDLLRFAGTLELAGFDASIRWKRVERIRARRRARLPRHGAARAGRGVARAAPLHARRPADHRAQPAPRQPGDRHRPLHAGSWRRADHRPPGGAARERRDAADRPHAAARRPLREPVAGRCSRHRAHRGAAWPQDVTTGGGRGVTRAGR